MKLVKERTIEEGQKVFVYFNLHKKCFSVKDVKTGLVVAHTDSISLYDCEFKVSEAGRQRVLREQRKNVHAGIVGHYIPEGIEGEPLKGEATYNPYKYETFVDRTTTRALERADWVVLAGRNISYE